MDCLYHGGTACLIKCLIPALSMVTHMLASAAGCLLPPQPRSDEDDVGGIAGATFEIAAAEMALCFHMSDHRLDGRAPRELAFDAAEDPAFLA